MVKENSEKKWLVLLVILVALSLAVDLLSLNILYSLSDDSDLGGGLASTAYSSSPHERCVNRCGRQWSKDIRYCEHYEPGSEDCILIANAAYESCVYSC